MRSDYSIFKPTDTLYTKGGEFSLNGKNYIGEYCVLDEKFYSGKAEDSTGYELTAYYNNSNNYVYDSLYDFNKLEKSLKQPIYAKITPLQSDYDTGYYFRYFLQSIIDKGKVPIEITSAQSETLGQPNGLDNQVNELIRIKWYLTGPNIAEKNRVEVSIAANRNPNIIYSIKNYIEFAKPNFI